MKQQSLLAAIFLCAASPAAFAENDNMLDEIVVTATRIAMPVSQTLAHTTVITGQEIEASGITDLPALLREQAGVEITQQGGVGTVSALHMRGTESTQSLVLLDGARIGSATTGATAIDQLMLDQIDRIEIVRGNVSSLYGSEAIGGVIQIFTKQGKGVPTLHASAGAGSLDTQRLDAGFGGAVNATRFNLEISRFRSGGISAIDPALVPTVNPDRNGYDNTSLSGSLRQQFNGDHSLSATYFSSQANTSFDNPFGLTTDVNTSRPVLAQFSLASDNRLSENWKSHLQWSDGVDDSTNLLNGMPSSRFKTENRQSTWQNTVAVNDHDSLLLGLENLNQQVASSTAYSQSSRNVNSLFGGYEGNYGPHLVQANYRQDHFPGFGTADTGLLGYGYAFTQALRATASYSTAFRAPTFNDLYWPQAYGYQGNPDLRPERSRNLEFGLHFDDRQQKIDMVMFNDRIRDLIDPGVTMPVNINQAAIDGFEFGYEGRLGQTEVQAGLTLQNPRDMQTGQTLIRRARSFSSVGVTQPAGAWRFSAAWRYSGVRQDSYLDPVTFASARQTLPAYGVINLRAAYAYSKRLRLTVRADNIGNQNDSSIYGYSYSGRTVFAGIDYRQ